MATYTAKPFKSFAKWNGLPFVIPKHSSLLEDHEFEIDESALTPNYLSTVDHYYNLAEVQLNLKMSTTTKPTEYKEGALPDVAGSPLTRAEPASPMLVNARWVVKNIYSNPKSDLDPRHRLAAEVTGARTVHQISSDSGLIEGKVHPSSNQNKYTSAYITSGTANGPTDPACADYSADFYLPITHQVFENGTPSSATGNTLKSGVFVITSEEQIADHFAANSRYGAKVSFPISLFADTDSENDADDFAPVETTTSVDWYIVPRVGFSFTVNTAYLQCKYYSYS